MPTVVGVSFKPVTKIYYFDPGQLLDLEPGDYVLVETSQGREVGEVVWSPRDLGEDEIGAKLKPVVRRATPSDLTERDRYQRREDDALSLCRIKVQEHKLPMKVVSAEYSYDGTRLVVAFTAESRVDFRELVRDLAKTFSVRIEMKQIGVRDEAKVLDGMGKCGRRLCCSSWLREFNPVTIKMAKQQNLPLNPAEISGVCGRLLCCLAYEVDVYTAARETLPRVGTTVETPVGRGRVRKVHPLRDTITVRLEEDESLQDFPAEQLVATGGRQGGSGRGCSSCGCAQRVSSRSGEEGRAPSNAPGADTQETRPTEDRPSATSRRRRRRKSSGGS